MHLFEDAGPVAGEALAEEADGGVPGGIVAVEEPAPVGDVVQAYPGWYAHGAGEVSDGCVAGDD